MNPSARHIVSGFLRTPGFWLAGALWSLQLGALLMTRIFQPERFSDDAFIHFRCSRNWADGLGMVFNPGEIVLGTTSPAWTFLLGCVHWMSRMPLPKIAALLNLGCDMGITILALSWFRMAGMGLGIRHTAVLVLNLEFWRMYFSATGMEMSLFILAVMLVLDFWGRKRCVAAGVVLGLIGWIRPEGAILWIVLLLVLPALQFYAVRRGERGPYAAKDCVGMFAIAVGISLGIAWILRMKFGTFLPQSLTAKSQAPWFEEGSGLSHVMFFIRLGDLTPMHAVTGFEAVWGRAADNFNSSLIAGVQVVMMLLGAWALWTREARVLSLGLVLFLVGFYLFHALLQPPIFNWYYVPYFFFALLLGLTGWHWLLSALVGRAVKRFPAYSRMAVHVLGSAFFLIACTTIFTLGYHGGRSGRMQLRDGEKFGFFRFTPVRLMEKERLYIAAAKRLRKGHQGGPNVRVACTEIGIFGYYFRGLVLDVYGLVSPEVLSVADPKVRATLPQTCREHPMDVWMVFRPEYIVSDWRWVPKPPPEFLEIYEPIKWRDIPLAVFRRKDMAS